MEATYLWPPWLTRRYHYRSAHGPTARRRAAGGRTGPARGSAGRGVKGVSDPLAASFDPLKESLYTISLGNRYISSMWTPFTRTLATSGPAVGPHSSCSPPSPRSATATTRRGRGRGRSPRCESGLLTQGVPGVPQDPLMPRRGPLGSAPDREKAIGNADALVPGPSARL
jgi:hypothetical protein